MPAVKPARDSAAGQRHALSPAVGTLPRRAFATLLAALLCCTLLPLGALASPDSAASPASEEAAATENDLVAAQPAEPEGDQNPLDPGTAAPVLPDDEATEPETPQPDEVADSESHEAGSFNHFHYATITASGARALLADDDGGSLRAGAQVSASVFKLENDDGIASAQVPDDGTFAYAWYAGDSRSTWSLSESDRISGANGATLAVTDDMAGKYLFVKVTASDGTSVKGPSLLNLPNGILRGAGPVATAVDVEPPATAPEAPDEPSLPADPPADPVEPDDPAEEIALSTATVTVVGTTKHRPGESFFYSNWISAANYHWPAGAHFTAWTAIAHTLGTSGYSFTAGDAFPSSITTPDGSNTLSTINREPRSFWALYVNDIEVSAPAYEVVLADGDRIELRYIDGQSPLADVPLVTHPQEETPDAAVVWGGSNNDGTGAATSLVTPTTNLSAGWTLDLSEGGNDGGWSDPLIVDDRLFLASATKFCVVDRATGQVVESTPLAGALDAGGCQPVYTAGKVVVPLANGQLQAFSVTSLHCIWVSEALPQATARRAMAVMAAAAPRAAAPQQSTSSLYAHDGRLYAATTIANGTGASKSWLSCFNVATGQREWVREGATDGFYWPGTAQLNGYILVGGADGTLEAIPAGSTTGEAAGSLQLGASAMAEAAAASAQDGSAYCVTRDGTFHKVRVSADGALEDEGAVRFAASSASTPTLCDGMAYVGGAAADGSGVLACIDTDSLECTVVNSAEVGKLPAEVGGTPLVSRQPTGTYVYFTCNGPSGGVFLYKAGDRSARAIYEEASSSGAGRFGNLVTSPDGRLYCVNAAGQLIELKERVAAVVPEPGQDAPGTTAPIAPETPTIDQMDLVANPRENLERRLAETSAPTATAAFPLTASVDSALDAETLVARPDRKPISSFIEDLTMQAQNVSLVNWVAVAAGGMALGLAALLLIVLPTRSLLRRKR